MTNAQSSSLDLSIIIPAKNAAELLPVQLDALLTQEWAGAWEVIVADNGSHDGTIDVVRRYCDEDARVRLIDASSKPGAGSARNAGVAHARGRALAFCDADDVVEPGWVEAMGEALRTHAAVGGRFEFERLNEPWLRTSFYSSPPDRIEYFAGVFPFTATANLGVQRSVFEAVGPFDDTYAPAEDLEFCLRLWAGGHELTYARDAVVSYRYRPTMRSLYRRSRDYAIGAVRIALRLHDLGHSVSASRGLRNYAWLVRHLPSLHSKAGRARWLVVAGGKWGRLVGSVRHRYLYL